MKTYTIIRTDEQYMAYCNDLEKMTSKYKVSNSNDLLDMIDTITLLIEKYDEEHSQLNEIDPIQLLKSLMDDNNLKQKDLAELLHVSKGHLSDILNYKKGLSKNIIRILSDRFKVRQSAFNKPYKLSAEVNKHYRNASMMNSKKDLETA
ncbi:MAG: type II toxin-antitoxin system HigA family antitoxin [Fulvivirga sp.]